MYKIEDRATLTKLKSRPKKNPFKIHHTPSFHSSRFCETARERMGPRGLGSYTHFHEKRNDMWIPTKKSPECPIASQVITAVGTHHLMRALLSPMTVTTDVPIVIAFVLSNESNTVTWKTIEIDPMDWIYYYVRDKDLQRGEATKDINLLDS